MPDTMPPADVPDTDLERELIVANGQDPEPPKPPAEDDAQPTETPDVPETPAAAPEAPAAEPAHEPAEGGSEEPEPAAQPPVAPAVPLQVAPEKPAKPAQPTEDPLAAELAQLNEQILSDDFDQFSREGKEAMLRRQDLVAEIHTVRQRVENDYWADTAERAGTTERTLKTMWREELTKAEGKYGKGTPASWAVAKEFFDQRVGAIEPGAPSPAPQAKPAAAAAPAAPAPPKGPQVKPPVAKTPITPTGARVAPPTINPVPPAPKVQSDEEELVNYMRRNVPGGIKGLRG